MSADDELRTAIQRLEVKQAALIECVTKLLKDKAARRAAEVAAADAEYVVVGCGEGDALWLAELLSDRAVRLAEDAG